MSAETVGRFIVDIRGRVDYFRQEYELTYAEAIGCIAILNQELLKEATDDED